MVEHSAVEKTLKYEPMAIREIAENKLFVPLHKCEKRSIKIDVS